MTAASSDRGEPEVVVTPDPDAAAREAAVRIAATLRDAVARRGAAHWATTGGSTPGPIYRALGGRPLRDDVPWADVHLWWGDDRFVPHDHPLSNVKPAADILLDIGGLSGESGSGASWIDVSAGGRSGVPIPMARVHPFPTAEAIAAGHDAGWCADLYAEMLRSHGPEPGPTGLPAFDLVLLGIGPDGHVLSVFPDSPLFDADGWALGVPAPTHVEPHVARVTLNPAIVPAARAVIVVVHGASKAAVLAEILGGDRDERRLPARLARREGATWILDEAAAAELGPR